MLFHLEKQCLHSNLCASTRFKFKGGSISVQRRSNWGGGSKGALDPHFNFRTKKGLSVSVSSISGIGFYG